MIKTTNNNLSKEFSFILMKGRKDNTYKFALARFLLDEIKKHYDSKMFEDKKIPYKKIAEAFLKYYWNQVVVYKLKQNFKKEKKVGVVKIIENLTSDKPVEFFDEFFKKEKHLEIKENLINEIYNNCLVDVIPRFQRNEDKDIYEHYARKVSTIKNYKRYYLPKEESNRFILLKKEAIEEIGNNYYILMEVLVLEWAKFLEKTNLTLNLIKKIENINNPKRTSLLKFRKILLEIDNDKCFYCNENIDLPKKNLLHIDHFIPWSYIFDNYIWNLVASCRKCNLNKHNRLPSLELLETLKIRNSNLNKKFMVKEESMDIYYNSCKEAGFLPWNRSL